MDFDVNSLTQTLSQYSPVVNDIVNLMTKAIRPIGYILISVFFLLEMLSWYRLLNRSDGGVTVKVWLEVGIKYLLAFILVWQSTTIFRAILEIFDLIIKILDNAVGNKTYTQKFDSGKLKGITKTIVTLFGNGIDIIASLTGKLLIFLRFFQMYILKAIAPIMVAFFMQDSLRPIAINFIKHFTAYALQGVVLIIIVKIYPAIITDDLLKVSGDVGGNFAIAFASMIKGILFIFILVQSGKLSQKLLGV